jgi:tRNA(Glu) U13 pseudouridine synthase TruD
VRPEAVELAAGADEFGPHVTVAFTLPAGSFATVFLRELTKSDDEDRPSTPPADVHANEDDDVPNENEA